MLKIQLPPKVKIFSGFIYKDYSYLQRAEKSLSKYFGPIDLRSRQYPFNFTDYYCREMGSPLLRSFVAFRKLQNSSQLDKIKKRTIKVEKKLTSLGKRAVNIDPGYSNLAKLVLATTKDYSHRIHIRGGIFAEVTLIYRQSKFHDLPWTYPDFRSQDYKNFFLQVRKKYQQQLKGL